jgi:ferredoxin
VQYVRSRKDAIFRGELIDLAARHPGLGLVFAFDDEAGGAGAFSEAGLAAAVPDFAERATYLCGPAGLMARVERMWQAAGASERLRLERFAAPALKVPPQGGSGKVRALDVQLSRSGRRRSISDEGTLLEALERAGERPVHGCRMGICKTCTCTKRAGTVRNLVTGAVSSQPDEEIQLCITAPLSDLELGL